MKSVPVPRPNMGGGAKDKILRFAPIIVSFLSALFLSIALSASATPGYMENVNVISFNMSAIGKNLIPSVDIANKAKPACEKAGVEIGKLVDTLEDVGEKIAAGVKKGFDEVKDGVEDVKDKIEDTVQQVPDKVEDVKDKIEDTVTQVPDKLKETTDTVKDFFGFKLAVRAEEPKKDDGDVSDQIAGFVETVCKEGAGLVDKAAALAKEVADKFAGSIAKALGLSEYYSLHLGNMCEGQFSPHFATPGATPNITCTQKFRREDTSLAALMDKELNIGGTKIGLDSIGIAGPLKELFNIGPTLLFVMGVFYLLTVLLIAVSFFATCYMAFLLDEKLCKWTKIAFYSALGAFGMGIFGTVGLTITAGVISLSVNKLAGKFGMQAQMGQALFGLLWTSFILLTIHMLMMFMQHRRAKAFYANGGVPYGKEYESSSSVNDDYYPDGSFQTVPGVGNAAMPAVQNPQMAQMGNGYEWR